VHCVLSVLEMNVCGWMEVARLANGQLGATERTKRSQNRPTLVQSSVSATCEQLLPSY